MLRLDLLECATDVLGDIDPCLLGRGAAHSTAAAQTESGLQFARDYMLLVFDSGHAPQVLEPASFFEFFIQFN